MVSISLTRVSSKGQIVIPSDMRTDINEGDELIIIKDEDRIILKKAEKISEQMKEDIEFARRTENALKRIESGEFISIDSDNLFEEMKKW